MTIIEQMTAPVYDSLMKKGRGKLAQMYRACFANTWETTMKRDGEYVYLVTGDIPAMWLRDSSAQVYHYLPFAGELPEVKDVIARLLRKQFSLINMDPRANAYNMTPGGAWDKFDRSDVKEENRPWIWERKYEIDSLCYPIRLAYNYWKVTGSGDVFDDGFFSAIDAILGVWETEQHREDSPYFFIRTKCPTDDTLTCEGRGRPVGYTGMTWSGFRPSDDACYYGYLIPSNLFAVKSLSQMLEITRAFRPDEKTEKRIEKLCSEIQAGIEQYGIVEKEPFGKVYAYETDGLGHYVFMDDANVPSLMSLPYLGCVDADDPVYQNTRRMILSSTNPFYYEGTAAKGIGSPHTPPRYIWPIALCVQGLTSTDANEIRALIDTLETTDAGTGFMHEGFHVDDPTKFTRPWFAWANSIFSEFVDKAEPYL